MLLATAMENKLETGKIGSFHDTSYPGVIFEELPNTGILFT